MSENASQSSSFRFSLGDLLLLVTYLAILMANIGALLPELGPAAVRTGCMGALGGLIGVAFGVALNRLGRRRFRENAVGLTLVRLRQFVSWRFYLALLAIITLITAAVKLVFAGMSRDIIGLIAVVLWMWTFLFLVYLVWPPVTYLCEDGLFEDGLIGPFGPRWWSDVKLKRWDHDRTGRLVFEIRWRRIRHQVPEEMREEVDALLREKLAYGEDESAHERRHD